MRYSTIFLILVVLAVATSATILSEEQYETLFVQFAKKYNKKYESNNVYERYDNFKKNLDYIITENTSEKSYTVAMNPTGDLSQEEYVAKYLGEKPSDDTSGYTAYVKGTSKASGTIDWEKKGDFPGILDQGQCGSCYAFCSVQALAHAGLRSGTLSKPSVLSAQQIVDCADSYGNNGCGGGLSTYVFEYAKKTSVSFVADYPYTASKHTCQSSEGKSGVSVDTYQVAASEGGIPELINQGMLAVSVAASGNPFRFYKSGVIDSSDCGVATNHCITMVGYNAEEKYYRIANSWGTTWGESGFVRIRAGKNMCGIARRPVLPTAK